MELTQYLRALRQWWWVIALCAVMGLGLGLFALPSNPTDYNATRTLLFVGDSEPSAVSMPTIQQLSFLVTSGDVPEIVAEKLGGDPAELASRVTASVDEPSSSISITATGQDARSTARLSDAFADALLESLETRALGDWADEVKQVEDRVAATQTQILASTSAEQREALTDTFTSLSAELEQLKAEKPEGSGLQSVAPAAASPSSSTGRGTRALITAAVGLLLGVGLALILTRFDTRIHTREQAEESFGGLPVIAEIPPIRARRMKSGKPITATAPESPASEAFRSLRSTLLLAPRSHKEQEPLGRRRRSKVRVEASQGAPRGYAVMVVSPGVGEGKSTCVANLAAAFAESGRRVLVLSCDLRRPAIDRYLEVDRGTVGVSDVLSGKVSVFDAVQETAIPDVRILSSGLPVANPGELLSHAAYLVGAARKLADVVIVDTPPVLATDDVSTLIPMVDDVIVVCRAGQTTAEAGERASDRLSRLGASVVGVVLNGVHVLPAVRSYYRSYAPRGANLPVAPSRTSPPYDNGESSANGHGLADSANGQGLADSTAETASDLSTIDDASGE